MTMLLRAREQKRAVQHSTSLSSDVEGGAFLQ